MHMSTSSLRFPDSEGKRTREIHLKWYLKFYIFLDYKGKNITWLPFLDSPVLGQFWLYLLVFLIQEM